MSYPMYMKQEVPKKVAIVVYLILHSHNKIKKIVWSETTSHIYIYHKWIVLNRGSYVCYYSCSMGVIVVNDFKPHLIT